MWGEILKPKPSSMVEISLSIAGLPQIGGDGGAGVAKGCCAEILKKEINKKSKILYIHDN